MNEQIIPIPIDIVFTIIFTLISLILGILMILRYFKYKIRELFFAGITWCLITSPFWGDIISYLWYLFFNAPLSDFSYFFLTIGLIPIAHVTWMFFFTSFFLKKNQKLIVAVFFIEAIMFEIVFIYLLIANPSFIGTRVPLISVQWSMFIILYFILSMLLFLITGITFTFQSFKSDSKDTNLKGKFLLIAFVSFMIGIIIELAPIFFDLKYLLSRLIILSAAIEFYIGFTLPNWIKKIFLEETY
ncbi:MAG: hypothetical protein EU539_04070 [Promethearchaeota archaeon]|nr:MAG: hypothetical protein EU539_04070 [Candidatus Lokiarchaeota archaeon]